MSTTSGQREPGQIASQWLESLNAAFQSADVNQIVALFLPNGWLRDWLVFSWDLRCQHGSESITSYLTKNFASRNASEFLLDSRRGLEPTFVNVGDTKGVRAAFVFTTATGSCRGLATLLQDERKDWKAHIVLTMLDELKGHPERGHESGLYDGHRLTWPEVSAQRRAEAEKHPFALIVGAGQTGLQVAARFGQMGIPYILIEKGKRIGDNWRQRYPTLTLHTPRTHYQFLYAPFPSTWPRFAPRDRLADWMEHYAVNQDLLVWTDSELLPGAVFNKENKKWTALIRRGTETTTLHPAHVVIATGVLGEPRMPQLPGAGVFGGDILHASSFPGGESFADKRVVVVGSGNTAADVCQDCVNRGARECWMIQRSSTAVVSSKFTAAVHDQEWPEGVPIDISDFKAAGMPFFVLRNILKQLGWPAVLDHDKQMHEGLRQAGFKLNNGPEDTGVFWAIFTTFGGFFVDVGCAQLIADGTVKVKQGAEPVRFEEHKIVFSDNSELVADTVIFATGYKNMRDCLRPIFGDEVIDRTSAIYGMDEEGELRGIYRPSGQDGLWFAAGAFGQSRAMSKQLGLQIQAKQFGIN